MPVIQQVFGECKFGQQVCVYTFIVCLFMCSNDPYINYSFFHNLKTSTMTMGVIRPTKVFSGPYYPDTFL